MTPMTRAFFMFFCFLVASGSFFLIGWSRADLVLNILRALATSVFAVAWLYSAGQIPDLPRVPLPPEVLEEMERQEAEDNRFWADIGRSAPLHR